MSIRLAVFDMAGTTVADKNNVAKAFQKAFAFNGIEIDITDVNPLMGYHKPEAIKMVLERMELEADAAYIDEIHADFVNEMMDYYEYEADVKPMPGAEEIFLLLKEKGIRIALNTGFSKNIADTIINRFQWKEKGLVDDSIGSDEVELGRPHTFMMQQLMQRAGVTDPQEVAKIGDTAVDMEEGHNAGCRYIIGVTTGAYNQDDLAKMNPTHIVHNLMELPAIILQ